MATTKMLHLYEIVIGNSQMWLKMQASCSSPDQSAAFFECRFTGTDYTMDGHQPVTPFRLSDRSHYIANWASIVDRLPPTWDDQEFHIVDTPYPWCEMLSEDCDCHGAKGRLDETVCSDFGLHPQTDRRDSRSPNVRHHHYIRTMEESIARRDEARRQEQPQGQQRSPPVGAAPVATNIAGLRVDPAAVPDRLRDPINVVNRVVRSGFYCSIHGRQHPYGDQSIRKTLAAVAAACVQSSVRGRADRKLPMSAWVQIATHLLEMHQSEECAERSVWGDVEIPDILYKYIPRNRIGRGAPNSLRATQLLALNDDMECNVTTMRGSRQEDTLAFLAAVQSEMEEHLGIAVPWEEMLTRSLRYGDVRVSTIIQEYLNQRVGVVSLSTDILVPTMWAHYARNTGIVVGYDTEALSAFGFELRPVVYSELAPTYHPSEADTIWLDFVNREHMERELRAGRDAEGLRLLARTRLAEFGAGWKSLSRLLLVKGITWAYEKEVRLLVELEHARDIGKEDGNGWPVKVIDPPPDAIREIYRGANTQKADVERAVQVARGDNKSGLFVGHVSSHAFRIQKTGGVNY